ncbi:MAG: MFS transporter [Sulfuritalea sp.]|nr:MFS transporter [Sulfuritalea sp.]
MTTHSKKLSMAQVLICGATIVTLSMGIRHGFGLWLQPVTQAQNWTRETFSMAIAIQNLTWGFAGIFAGMLADRFGAFRVIIGGAILYALGLFGMAHAPTPLLFALTAGVLIGMAQAGTTYAVIYGVIGRNVSLEKRSWAMGVAAAAGSFGQFLMIPVASGLIGGMGWFGTLLVFAASALLIIPLGGALTKGLVAGASGHGQTAREALGEAMREKSFVLLIAGYFVCGFQVVFIGVHFPTYLIDKDMGPDVGMTALALIGLFNVFGSYSAGHLGNRLPKRHVLAGIYAARSVVISLFLWAPLSPASVYLFAATMGLLWLSTVPLTNAIVAQVFGVRFLGMLSGLVFFSHQVGSFLGVWLGGLLFDATGAYDTVWGICILLGVLSALIHLPIDERSLEARRLATAV